MALFLKAGQTAPTELPSRNWQHANSNDGSSASPPNNNQHSVLNVEVVGPCNGPVCFLVLSVSKLVELYLSASKDRPKKNLGISLKTSILGSCALRRLKFMLRSESLSLLIHTERLLKASLLLISALPRPQRFNSSC